MTSPTVPRNAYTDAPELHPNVVLASLQLLLWLFFHPSAWRSHIQRIDPDLSPDVCLAELTREQWRSPALRRVLLIGYGVWPPFIALSLGSLMGLLFFGPRESYRAIPGVTTFVVYSVAYGAMLGVTVSLAAGVVANVVGGVALGVTLGVFGYGVDMGMALAIAVCAVVSVTFGATISAVGSGDSRSLGRSMGAIIIGLLIGGGLSAARPPFSSAWQAVYRAMRCPA